MIKYRNYFIFSSFVIFLINRKESKKEAIPTHEETVVQELKSPAADGSSLPFMFSNEDKTFLSWVEKVGDSTTILKYAELIDGTWQHTKEILQGTDWFVNWADFPMIAENQGNLWSHVLKKSTEGTYSYDVKMNVLPKGDKIWKTNMSLHTDGTPTEHGFVSVVPYKNSFFVNWLDGRNTAENEVGERGAMTLRAAEVAADGGVITEHELDARTCDCCQTTAAITTNGPVVIYRNRSQDEVRDISIVRQVDEKWTSPKLVHSDNWKIKGCPVNGPKAAALGNSLAVAWFTGAQQDARVQLAFSQDGGASFGEPVRINEATAIGRVDVLLIDARTAIVCWMEMKEKRTLLKAVKVMASGREATSLVVTESDASRKTGFPQMELVGDKVYFAWTDISNKTTTVKSAYISLKHF